MKIIVEPGDENPAADALNGVYERHYQIKPGDMILDLGAHAGYFTSVAYEKVGPTGRVVAFEPHPGNFDRLVRRCGEIAMCINAGAWDMDGFLDLWPAINNSGGHSFFQVPAGQEDVPIKCRVVDIGPWLVEQKWKPNFVKIDTELAELRILVSLMRTELRPEIAAEIHNREMWDACREVLSRRGYHLFPKEAAFTNYYLYAWV